MPVMSMTGFGRYELDEDGRKLMLELKSVNHRFLDIGMRLPRIFNAHEDFIRKQLQNRLTRGHVDVFIKYENHAEGSQSVEINQPLLQAYMESFAQIENQFHLENDTKLSHILRLPEVLTCTTAPEDDEALRAVLGKALNAALDELIALRTEEGRRLAADLQEKITAMRTHLSVIEQRAPLTVEEYREKLSQRIGELMDNPGLEEGRLAAEVALFADRSCIDEEIVRLKSHMEQFEKNLQSDAAVGRQMDFIVQEMNREVNTICSKSVDAGITAAGLALKGEIEKIREQVQNIE